MSAVVAMTRAGIHALWTERDVPRVRVIEVAPIAVLLLLCAVQTLQAGPIMRMMQATAESLHSPRDYVREVLRPASEKPGGAR